MRRRGRFVGSAHVVGWIPLNGPEPMSPKKKKKKGKAKVKLLVRTT